MDLTYNFNLKCGKCGDRRAAKGQAWCKSCFAEYRRDYRKTAESRAVRRARKDGFEAFRLLVVAAFEQIGSHEIDGWRAAQIAREIA